MGSMRNWLEGTGNNHTKQPEKRVAVVHCKAGKGRSGTIATAYLISQEGWKKEDALRRFTERRMRVGFGNGVSIPSQLRYVGYVDRWANQFDREYVERPVEVLEIHVWGLRDGVKIAVEGFEDEGKKIKCFHMFHRSERTVIAEGNVSPKKGGHSDVGTESPLGKTVPASTTSSHSETSSATSAAAAASTPPSSAVSDVKRDATISSNRHLSAMIFRPKKPLIIPGSDVNINFERRSKASYTGFAMVTSVAHAWFNAYFEGGREHDSGVFETEWDEMDGIKGTVKKGIRAFERMKVVWQYAPSTGGSVEAEKGIPEVGRRISQPKPGEAVPESAPADWRGQQDRNQQENQVPGLVAEQEDAGTTTEGSSSSTQTKMGKTARGAKDTLSTVGSGLEKSLGLRKQTVESKDVSLAGSEDETRSTTDDEGRAGKTPAVRKEENGDLEGVRPYFAENGNGSGKPQGEKEREQADTKSKE